MVKSSMKLQAVFIILSFTSVVFVRGDRLTAVCHMEPNRKLTGTSSTVTGKITLVQQITGGPTQVTVQLKGLPSHSVHGFHIHNSGDIISNGCQSCGPHYRPDGTPHAGPRDRKRHIGDLGNVMSNGSGDINTAFIDYLVSLQGKDSVMGRSIVIHISRDDLGRGVGSARKESLKTGNAGARLACCSIVHV